MQLIRAVLLFVTVVYVLNGEGETMDIAAAVTFIYLSTMWDIQARIEKWGLRNGND